MNSFSKTHKRFSERLNNPRVLTNPQEFLGPNFEAVLNFWLFLDDLTEEQWRTINGLYWNFYNNQRSEWEKATDEALKTSEETIGREFSYNAGLAAYDAANDAYWDAWGATAYAARWATREIIGMHILLDQQKPLTFFNMYLEP